jgi:hypothetical protein
MQQSDMFIGIRGCSVETPDLEDHAFVGNMECLFRSNAYALGAKTLMRESVRDSSTP